ncbi:MAG: class I adenylate-forming enzyme family protein [Alphaproteobacteria bacterium]|nr:class I adenylate-forming enzyme family protein [Alphaproteobacteria bacterium]
MNLADILSRHAETRPDRPAIEDGDRTITYGELDVRVTDAAARLQAAGVRSGDVVGVMLPDSADHLIVLWALARAGGVALSLNAALPMTEKLRSVAQVDVTHLITDPGSPGVGDLRVLPVQDVVTSAPPEATETAPFVAPALRPEAPVTMLQTSGTTGAPKLIVRSHAQFKDYIRRDQQGHGFTPTDRYLAVVRMSFSFGRDSCLSMTYIGATVVIDRSTSRDGLIAAVREERITALILTPAHLRALLDHADVDGVLFPQVRALVVGSAAVTSEERLRARLRLTPSLQERYGLNETGAIAVAAPADQDAVPDAVGRLLDGIDAQVVDSDGRPLPTGEVGLIGFRGAHFPTGYFRDPDETARAFRDGWFYPSDLAALNDDGYVFLKGRADDVISNEGAMFYPIEVENVLLMHPAVAEVAAFGWPHPRQGEVTAAAVVMKSAISFDELFRHCQQHLAAYKVPKMILAVQEMPKNPMGKIVKAQLKELLRKELAKDST